MTAALPHPRLALSVLAALLAASAPGISLRAGEAPPAATPPPAPSAAPAAPAIVTLAAPKANEVVPAQLRERLLAVAGRYLDRDNPALQSELKTAPNPFFPPPPPPPEAVVVDTSGSKPPAPGPALPPPVLPKLTDDEKLEQIATVLVPSGVLIGNERAILKFPNGRNLAVGESVLLTFPNETTPTAIVLAEVTPTNFKLKLNAAELVVPLTRPKASSSAPPGPGSSAAPASTPPPAQPPVS